MEEYRYVIMIFLMIPVLFLPVYISSLITKYMMKECEREKEELEKEYKSYCERLKKEGCDHEPPKPRFYGMWA